MKHNKPWKMQWYDQRSEENNPRKDLVTIVESTPTDNNYSADKGNRFSDYAARVARSIFSSMPTPVKYAAVGGLAFIVMLTGACKGNATPTPSPTPNPPPITPTAPIPAPEPTILELLDEELSQFPDYAQNEVKMLRQEALSDDTVTQKEADGIKSIVNNPLFLTVSKDDNLTDEFKLGNFTSLFKELKESPYADKLMKSITATDPKENVSQSWNYKVRREDDVLFNLLKLSPDNSEGWQFRFDKGAYHLKLWTDGNSIMDLSNHGLKELFENKEDAEYSMMQFWVPDAMVIYDLTKWRQVGWLKSDKGYIGNYTDGQPSQEAKDLAWKAMKNNMSVYLGKEKIKGQNKYEFNQYKDLRDRIVSVHIDHTIKSYPWPESWNNTDYKEGMYQWERQDTIEHGGFQQVPRLYKEIIVATLDKSWKNFELIKLAYGLGVLDMTGPEGWDTLVNQIYQNALGYVAFEQTGRNPLDSGSHQYAAFVIPKQFLQQFPSDVIVFRGQSVSPYSMEDGLKSDGVKYVREPNGPKIVWRNPDIKK